MANGLGLGTSGKRHHAAGSLEKSDLAAGLSPILWHGEAFVQSHERYLGGC
jgi:hypothetical protein